MLSRGRFIMGRVSTIDRAAKTLTCSTLAGERRVPYEHLVLAFGNRARLDLIPGLAEHALPLKTVGDAMHPGPSTYRPDMLAREMLDRMVQHDLISAPVTTSDGRLVGLVLRRDLERALAPTESGSREGSSPSRT